MRRETQNVLLVLLGGALCKLVLSGAHTRYVKPSMGPWMLAAGALLVLLALVAIGRDILAARHGAPPGAGDEHDDHRHGTRSPWLLVLPVLAVFLIAPPALGSDSVSRAGGVEPAEPSGTTFEPLPRGEVVPMTLSDFVTRSAYDGSNALNSRDVRLRGFLVRDSGNVFVARLAITCCAADAMPLKVRLLSGRLGNLRADAWVEVTGRLVPGSADADTDFAPALRVRSVGRIAPPADPYEH